MKGSQTSAADIRAALRCDKAGCECATAKGHVHCPAHKDVNRPNLSVDEKNGKLLLKCFGGCSQREVISALREQGLWGAASSPVSVYRSAQSGRGRTKASTSRETEWVVRDLDGHEIARHVRFDHADGHKSYAWRRNGGSGLGELKARDLPLYGTEKLAAAASEEDVIICEGEKVSDSLMERGYLALGTVTGAAGCPSADALKPVAQHGGRTLLWPDNDAPGRAHMDRVAAALDGLGKRPLMITWPDAPVKGDAADFTGDVNTVLGAAKPWEPASSSPAPAGDVRLVRMADVAPETVSWLWKPYLPLGKITLLEGDPGVGKSWLALAIATAVSLGCGLPGGWTASPAPVVLASAEDGLADTLRPRLDAMGADVRLVHAISGSLTFDADGLATLEDFINRIMPALVVVDPLVAYLGAAVDMFRANETRAVMAKLADTAERDHCAILAVRHLTKGGQSKSIYRGQGSIDFTAAARSVLLAGCDPEQPATRALVQLKSNLAAMGAAIAYELKDDAFYWRGSSDLTAGRILAAEGQGDGGTRRDEALDFLREELADGPADASRVWQDAKAIGLAERTVNRAKATLGVITRRWGEPGKRGAGKFTWQLPDGGLEGQHDLHCQDGHIEKGGNVNNSTFGNGDSAGRVGNLNHAAGTSQAAPDGNGRKPAALPGQPEPSAPVEESWEV